MTKVNFVNKSQIKPKTNTKTLKIKGLITKLEFKW